MDRNKGKEAFMTKKTAKKELDASRIGDAVAMLRILAHPLRLSLLCRLIEKGEMSVSDLVASQEGRFSQSQVSQYLKVLRENDLVTTRRDRQNIYYAIKSREVQETIKTLHDLYCR